MTNQELATKFQAAVLRYAGTGSVDASEDMLLMENEICARANIDLDETEQGLTLKAVLEIEAFVSEHSERPWTYEDAGLLGVSAYPGGE